MVEINIYLNISQHKIKLVMAGEMGSENVLERRTGILLTHQKKLMELSFPLEIVNF
jgi:hypothetical protein